MSARRVLLTNWALVNRGGSELYTRDVAAGLLRRGHEPVVWAPSLGAVADTIRESGVEVIEDLSADRPVPDLIHGQHHDETLAALARFPGRPGLFVQHGAVPWQEQAPIHPRLLRYIGVDELCRQRLAAEGIPSDRITVIGNAVDLERFTPRDPLPARPRRALVLSNTAHDRGFAAVVRDTCERAGIQLEVAGTGVGRPLADPEHHLGEYDLVFAKARAALEALAVGCAVVVIDEPGLAGLVTSENLEGWLPWNLGRHLLTKPLKAELISAELDRYDPDDAARCRDHVRTHRDLERMLDGVIAEHDHVVRSWLHHPPPDHRAELIAASARLELIGPLRNREDALRTTVASAAHRLDAVIAERDECRRQVEAAREAQQVAETERDLLRERKAVRWVDSLAARRWRREH